MELEMIRGRYSRRPGSVALVRGAALRSIVRLVVLSTLLLTGCSSRPSDQPPLGTVSGKVTLDGKPLEGATIFFSPEGGGRTSAGRTDAEGRYELTYVGKEMGAKVGPNVIRITTSEEVTNPKTGRSMHTPEKIPARYNEKSELKRDVEGKDNTIDLELTSAAAMK